VILIYVVNGPGVVVLVALAALILSWRRGLLAPRPVSLLAFWIAVPVLQFIFKWDSWERYMLPLMPMCALVVSVAAVRASAAWPVWWRRGVLAALVLAGGGHLALTAPGLVWISGLQKPDTRPYKGLARTLDVVPPEAPVLVVHSVFDDQLAFSLHLRQPPRHRRRLYSLPVKDSVWSLPPGIQVRHVLRVQVDKSLGMKWEQPPYLGLDRFNPAELHFEDSFSAFKKIEAGGLEQLARNMDPNGLTWTLYQASPPITASAASGSP